MEKRENSASISALLRAIPHDLHPIWDGGVVRLAYDGREWMLLPVWAGEGLPADAKRVRNEIVHGVGAHPNAIPVVTARRVSPGAREILDSQHLSWADASGRAEIVIPGHVYIARFEPIRADAGRSFRWSAAAEAIAETLLAWRTQHGGGEAMLVDKVAVVAEAADVSVAHAARILRHFDEQGYTAKVGAERGSSATREFRDPGRMLSDWAGHYAATGEPGRAIEFHVPWRDPEESISVLLDALDGQDWALTGEAAADHIAPHLTSVPTVDLYVAERQLSAARSRLLQHPDVTEVESGGRIRMHLAAPYIFKLAQEARAVRTVAPVRVYADLLRARGRSAEAGEYLREATIGF